MKNYVTRFHEDENDYPIVSVDTDDAVVVSVGDSLRLHTTAPSEWYVVTKIKRQITIHNGELIGLESNVYLKRE